MNFGRLILLLLSILSIVYPQSICPTLYNPGSDAKNLDSCKDIESFSTPSDYDPNKLYAQGDEFTSCCFMEYTVGGNSGKSCVSLTDEEVADHSIAYKKLLNIHNGATGTIICEEDENNSSFIKSSLLFYILLTLI